MSREVSLKELEELNFTVDGQYGLWYDWFCDDKALTRRGQILTNKLKAVLKANKKGKRFDPDKTYVFYKNNCPAGWGPLYDDFRICEMTADGSAGDVLYTVVPSCGVTHEDYNGRKRTEYHAELHGRGPDGVWTEIVSEGAWEDVIRYFEMTEAEWQAKKLSDARKAELAKEISTLQDQLRTLRSNRYHLDEDIRGFVFKYGIEGILSRPEWTEILERGKKLHLEIESLEFEVKHREELL